MPVLLRRSAGAVPDHDRFAIIGGDLPDGFDPARLVPGLANALEAAFDAIADEWLELGRHLGADPSAVLAHTPSCAPNVSDLGLMLAWTRLVEQWAGGDERVLVVCDDPWVFRHLATRPGVDSGPAPALVTLAARMALRGMAARALCALRQARAAWTLRRARRAPLSAAWLMVYGHPRSTPSGHDAYFGDLMAAMPGLRRVLHVDCTPARADGLRDGDGRTLSLHAWGSPLVALACLPTARWKPAAHLRGGRHGWLVRRAAAREGATAQAAMIRWQMSCQRRWLDAVRPARVAWPWENHGWERDFVRQCRRRGIATLGYQHSVVGRQMLNYSPASNPDGADSLPDRVACTGAATQAQLAGWGFPQERLEIGGALRFASPAAPAFDPAAPTFLALPFDGRVAAQMIEAARRVPGRTFLAKDHPMTPFQFADGDNVRRTDKQLGEIPAVSAVVFAATTVGLEALLAGLPTIRFQTTGCVALDILPKGTTLRTADVENLGAVLDRATPEQPPPRERIFAGVDMDRWRAWLGTTG